MRLPVVLLANCSKHIRNITMASNMLARVKAEEKYRDKNLPEVIYKSDNFLCINKGYDIKINFDDPTEMTVEHQLRKMFPELIDHTCAHGFRFTHRLDYATSGILCLSLNKKAAQQLTHQFKYQHVVKYYLALVRGDISDNALFIDVPTGDLKDKEWPGRRCVASHPACSNPKTTQTLLVCLQRGLFQGMPASKVLLKPFTGRQHQLRVHCDYIGHTIAGDYTYSLRQDTDPDRMMLHSYRLITNMSIENLDLKTSDPFTLKLINDWVPHSEQYTLEEAERIASTFDPLSTVTDVKIVRLDET